jgi:hypothetical protein
MTVALRKFLTTANTLDIKILYEGRGVKCLMMFTHEEFKLLYQKFEEQFTSGLIPWHIMNLATPDPDDRRYITLFLKSIQIAAYSNGNKSMQDIPEGIELKVIKQDWLPGQLDLVEITAKTYKQNNIKKAAKWPGTLTLLTELE